MAFWMGAGLAIAVVILLGVFALRRLSTWSDPSLDSQEKQAEAFLWSQRSGSGGWGS